MEKIMPWVLDPHSGGTKIPPRMHEKLKRKITDHATKKYSGKFESVNVRFRNQFCYIEAIKVDDKIPTKLCRLRYFSGRDQFSVAFYAYSTESYQPSLMENGEWFGSVEQGFDVGAVYLY
jgi:hypothetical protein